MGSRRLHSDTHVECQYRVTWLLTGFHLTEASGPQISASQRSENVFCLITRLRFPRLFSVVQCMFCSWVSGSFTEVPDWCISSLSKRGSFWFHNSSNLYLELRSWVDWDQNREQRFACNSSINLWTICIDKNWSLYSTPWNVLTSWEIRNMNSQPCRAKIWQRVPLYLSVKSSPCQVTYPCATFEKVHIKALLAYETFVLWGVECSFTQRPMSLCNGNYLPIWSHTSSVNDLYLKLIINVSLCVLVDYEGVWEFVI